MRRQRTKLFLFLMVGLLFVPGCKGCKSLRAKLGGIKVTNPEKGTPEYVVQEALKAAAEKDEAVGWAKFKALLHPETVSTALAYSNWRRFAWMRMRRSVNNYLLDQSKFSFKIERWVDVKEGRVHLFIKDKTREMAKPIKLWKDKKGNWLIAISSL